MFWPLKFLDTKGVLEKQTPFTGNKIDTINHNYNHKGLNRILLV